MSRCSVRHGIALATVALLAAVSSFGCQAAFLTAMYVLRGTDVEPDFKGLKGKRVAVVCRPLVSLQYRNATVGRDIAQEITKLLKERVPKIKTIDQQKIAQWTDKNTWTEYVEVGKAVDADMIVAVDLESFSLYEGQTLFQGKANATVKVFDCRDGGKLVFEKNLPQSLYPPNSAVPASERTEPQFRREFVRVLADQIARHFYAHDPHADMAQDAAWLDQ